MAICIVSGNMQDVSGNAAMSVTVSAYINEPLVLGNSLITPFEVSAVTDVSGNFFITVQQSISVIFTVEYPIVGTEPMRTFTYTGNIPATATASFNNVIVIE